MRVAYSSGIRLLALSAWSLVAGQAASAQTIAITGGTVFPVGAPKIERGTVLIANGRITAVGASVTVPAGATIIDATGKWVTPGLVNAMTTLGLNEAGGPQFSGGYSDTRARTVDGVAATFDAVDGINPASTFIRPTSQDGITTVGVFPEGNWVAGRGSMIDLHGATLSAMVRQRHVGMMLNFDAGAANAGARGAMVARLRTLLEEVGWYALYEKEAARARTRTLTTTPDQLAALLPVVRGTMPLVVVANRASDIRAMLELAREHRLKVIIAGGAEAWQVARELAAAKVPVMVGALNNIPQSFDALGQRQENAALLRAAGVAVSIIGNGPGDPASYNVRNIRQEAGNAVAYGMSWDEALRAVTLAPAEALGVVNRVGTLASGMDANVVVWDGDPFEFSTKATHVYIRGVLQQGASRQDELQARYKTLPPSFAQPSTGQLPAGSPPAASAMTNETATIEGAWTLVRLSGRSASPAVSAALANSATRAPTLTFSSGRVSGFGGCNRYTGSVTIADASRLTFGAMASTRMACAGAAGAIESAFLATLSTVTAYRVSAGSLELRDANGVVATFTR